MTQPPPAPAEITAESVRDWLAASIAARLGVPAGQVRADRYVDELNLDSVDAVLVARDLEAWLGEELGREVLRRRATLEELGAYLARRHALAAHRGGL
ncbi:acyl carrier protein [Streptomyces sp. TRM 70351]|uniref:acyl carrier protein n=1 Tax=Streptomyces sp. TRM 70351 TaxID=3116552 RepID=UPI002E7B0D60|nr:acyl carrier protein [Streptomyces sp. TRM 70351]MEE1931079.1 acyl carrier protein [Streptomyces sp. TRM 70351]